MGLSWTLNCVVACAQVGAATANTFSAASAATTLKTMADSQRQQLDEFYEDLLEAKEYKKRCESDQKDMVMRAT